MDFHLVVIGCKEYSHTIIIFRCTLYRPTRKPETVLPISCLRPIFRGGDVQSALRKFGEKRFPSLCRFSPFFGASGAFLRYEHYRGRWNFFAGNVAQLVSSVVRL
jgi:hypothetical protein